MTRLFVLIVCLVFTNTSFSDETLPIPPRETEVLTVMPRVFTGDPAQFEGPSIIRGSTRPYGTYDAPFGTMKVEISKRQLEFLKALNSFKSDLDPAEIEKEFLGPEILTIAPRLIK